MKKEYPEVKVGQIYQDRDKRNQGRRLKGMRIDGVYAYCNEVSAGGHVYHTLRTRISLKSLQTRFTLIGEAF